MNVRGLLNNDKKGYERQLDKYIRVRRIFVTVMSPGWRTLDIAMDDYKVPIFFWGIQFPKHVTFDKRGDILKKLCYCIAVSREGLSENFVFSTKPIR